MNGANEIQDHLVESLEADLVGPFGRKPGDAWSDAGEVLRNAPSRVYLTGFLVPDGAPPDEAEDPTEEDDALGDDEDDLDVPAPEPTVRRRGRLPSSFGLSVLVPAAARELVADLQFRERAEYAVGHGVFATRETAFFGPP